MNDNPFLVRSKILEENQEYLSKAVITISNIFSDVINNGGKLIFAGNGGSAAEAQHMSAEYVGTLVTSNKRKPISSISLTTDTSFITAWSNDQGFEDIFRRQLEALAQENDCFISYSTSGESKNILKAIKFASTKNLKTISFTGSKDSSIAKASDFTFRAPSENTAIIQEIHTIVGHEICSIVDKQFS